jgi:hypothetical protein
LTPEDGYLGVIGFNTKKDGSGLPLSTFCIDLSQNVQLDGGGPYSFAPTNVAAAPITNSIGTMGDIKAGQLSQLYGLVFSSLYAPTDQGAYHDVLGSLTPNLQVFEQAFQMAVSDIVYGDGSSVDNTSSGFYVTSALTGSVQQANHWLADLASGDSMQLYALTDPLNQDQVIPVNSLTEIPEPSTYAAILGVAALGFAVIRRRQILGAV